MQNNSCSEPWLRIPITRKLLVVFVLTLFAVGLNFWRLPLFFGVEFIFGSIFAVITLCLLGVKAAILVGVAAAAVTFILWGHPYAWIIFTTEILWLSWRWYIKPQANLVILDLTFWVILGLPLVFIFYWQVLDIELHTTSLIWLKQLTNGVFNSLIACTLLLVFQLNVRASAVIALPKVKIQRLLFYTFSFLTLLAGVVPLVLDAQKLKEVHQLELQKRLQILSHIVSANLQQQSIESLSLRAIPTSVLQSVQPDKLTLLLRNAEGNLTYLSGELNPVLDAQVPQLSTGFHQVRPLQNAVQINNWSDSWFITLEPLSLKGEDYALIVATPAKALAAVLRQDGTRQLLLMVTFLLISILISWWFSRLLAMPLRKLATSALALITDINRQNPLVLPAQQVVEYQELATSLSDMRNELQQKFQDNAQILQQLEQQVQQRTIEVERSRGQLEAILSAAKSFSIIATDMHGVITYFSPGAERLLGYSADELVGKHTPLLIHLSTEVEQRANELSSVLKRPITGFDVFTAHSIQYGSETREWTYQTQVGKLLPVSLTVSNIVNSQDKVVGFLGIAIDISERHRSEKLKNEFISTVSHELRTPLTSIYGALSLLASGRLIELPAKVENLVKIACKNSERLTMLINDLLDIEKLVAGMMTFDSSSQALQPLISEAVEGLFEYANKFDITLVMDLPAEPINCRCDPKRFIQVLTNLVSNAVKFSVAPADVYVKLMCRGDEAVVEVVDQGIGVPEEFKPRIFERFAQGDAANTRKQGGTGLGLAICKELVQQMGGRIDFDSEVNKGSTFRVYFPL